MYMRGPSWANSSGPTNSGTPARPTPIRNDPLSTLIGDSGPIKSATNARQYLETNGWVLSAETYDRNKIAKIITTVALGGASHTRSASNTLKPEARNALLAVAFLIDDDMTDNIANTLAEAVAAKALARLEPLATSLATSVSFASANDTNRANNTITLQSITDKLVSSINTLDKAPSPIPLPPVTLLPPPHMPSWASIVSANIPTSTVFNPEASDSHTRLQQWILKDSRVVTFDLLIKDPSAPQDQSPSGLAKLRTTINDTLAIIDEESQSTHKTLVRGIREVSRNDPDKTNLVLKLDSPDSAKRITEYATNILHNFPNDVLGNTAQISV
ncbi:hypothetical protein C0991_005022 [Blastosporella zonata]|nr:hypothetical protein C0991_005022 [Blastosporella zonata]